MTKKISKEKINLYMEEIINLARKIRQEIMLFPESYDLDKIMRHTRKHSNI